MRFRTYRMCCSGGRTINREALNRLSLERTQPRPRRSVSQPQSQTSPALVNRRARDVGWHSEMGEVTTSRDSTLDVTEGVALGWRMQELYLARLSKQAGLPAADHTTSPSLISWTHLSPNQISPLQPRGGAGAWHRRGIYVSDVHHRRRQFASVFRVTACSQAIDEDNCLATSCHRVFGSTFAALQGGVGRSVRTAQPAAASRGHWTSSAVARARWSRSRSSADRQDRGVQMQMSGRIDLVLEGGLGGELKLMTSDSAGMPSSLTPRPKP